MKDGSYVWGFGWFWLVLRVFTIIKDGRWPLNVKGERERWGFVMMSKWLLVVGSAKLKVW
jgi:hypothetical protein